jgi:PTH2 family peptidyl-tRNA hydrolase
MSKELISQEAKDNLAMKLCNTMQSKQVIVIRKDLKMRKGKLCSQASHASMKVILDQMTKSAKNGIDTLSLDYISGSPMDDWLNDLFTKICVYVNSEEELDELYAKAQELNILSAMIIDVGKTEFNGVPTKTCIAIGPDTVENVDKITKGLPLL